MAQFDGPAPLAWRWSEATTVSPSGTPVVSGDTVYVAVGGRIYSLDRATGNQNWRYPAGEPLTGNFRTSLIMAGDKIVAASDQRIVYAVDAATGRLAWQYSAPDAVVGPPVVTEGVVAVPLSNNSIAGIGLNDGAALWGGNPVRIPDRVYPNMAAWGGGIIYATTGSLVMMDASTGRTRWSQRFARLSSTVAPVVFGDTVYVNSGTFINALRANSGTVRWSENTQGTLTYPPAVGPDGVVVVTQEERLIAFDLSGRPFTRQGFDLDNRPSSAPAWAGRFVVIPTAGGSVLLVDPKSGETTWSYTIPALSRAGSASGGAPGGAAGPGGFGGPAGGGLAGQPGGASSPARTSFISAAGPATAAGGTLFVLALDGSLLAFDKVNGVDLTAPTARMLWPTAGDQVSPKPPTELVFRIEDYTSGVNPGTVKVTINGQEYGALVEREGIVRIIITDNSRNKPLPLGRAVIVLTASDWLGNKMTSSFTLLVDSTIDRPLGGPPRNTGAGGGPGGAGGGASGVRGDG